MPTQDGSIAGDALTGADEHAIPDAQIAWCEDRLGAIAEHDDLVRRQGEQGAQPAAGACERVIFQGFADGEQER